ncbi:hypothetical protein MIN45_P0375 [Methylomarinovum tepidoasis]|uniref:DUF4199 domain-containing protein n=1 Tax=Methylomarinovum tepidoasis TaxID=2840183 RepID=A0AAU9CNZ2_9GAMM|nr:hypothetical protein [Methylomarinovum sp. IN45]BCX88008.1 hypothetical protein MIN45_P0375 [Methylomarinovum sp. IN45]
MSNETETLQSKYKSDLIMWAGIGVVSVIFIVIFSVFTTTSPIDLAKKILSAILIMFLPGYVIVKLYLDDLKLSRNPAVDKFILSFGLSMVTVQSLSFLVNYFAVYGENLDQEVRIQVENLIPPMIVTLVIATAVGLKFFSNKIAAQWEKLNGWFQAKMGEMGSTLLLVLATALALATLLGILRLTLYIAMKVMGIQPY